MIIERDVKIPLRDGVRVAATLYRPDSSAALPAALIFAPYRKDDLNAIDEKIKAQVQESVEFAEASPYPTADEFYKDVYVQQDYPYIRD